MNDYKHARGPRVLPETEFPWLDSAVQAVDKYRKQFEELERIGRSRVEGDCTNLLDQQLYHFHPVISIFAPRGMGKTTALLTLLDQLKKKCPTDIVLAPLEPHRFMQEDRILYWFLAALKPYVDKLSQVEEKAPLAGYPNHYSDAREFNLQTQYHELQDQVRWIYLEAKQNTGDNDSQFAYKFRNHYLAKGLDFGNKLNRFIRELTNLYAACLYKSDRQKAGQDLPLLLLPIDDADLVPEYLEDLFTFLRILSVEVTRLVILVTADDQLAVMSSKGRYLRNLFPEWYQSNHVEGQIFVKDEVNRTVDELSAQFLTKFLPYSGRFYIHPFDEERRMGFWPVVEWNRTDENLPVPFKELLQELGLIRFFQLDWAIGAQNASAKSIWSNYIAIISGNPRLLEQAYDILERASRHSDSALSIEDIRKTAIQDLSRLFISSPFHESLKRFNSVVKLESVGHRRALITKPYSSVSLSFLPLGISSGADISGMTQGVNVDIELFGAYEAFVSLKTSSRRAGIEMSDPGVPAPLAYAYLFLQELQRDQLGHFDIGGRLPGVYLNRTGEIELDISNNRAGEEDRPSFKTIYPLAIFVKKTKQHLGLPMPSWRFPIQWWIFLRYWDLVQMELEEAQHLTSGKRYLSILSHIVDAAIKITVMDPMAEESAPAGRLYANTSANTNIESVLSRLQRAYYKDISEGDGILAVWVEQGLYRFLALLEAKGNNPFASLPFTCQRLKESVLKPTAVELDKQALGSGDVLNGAVERIDTSIHELKQESELLTEFRTLYQSPGAGLISVGVLGEESAQNKDENTDAPDVSGPTF